MRVHEQNIEYSEIALSVSYSEYQNVELLPHWHKENEIYYIKKGAYEFSVNNVTIYAKTGDVVVVNSGDIHFLKSTIDDSAVQVVFWNPYRLENSYSKNSLIKNYISKEDINSKNINMLLETFYDVVKVEIEKKEEFYIDVIISRITEIWAVFARHYKQMGRAIGKERLIAAKKIDNILTYMFEHHAEDITLDKMARMANYSPAHLSVVFSKVLGINFKKYLDIIRIEKSINEIIESNKTISQIALSNGFNNIRSFNRTFKNLLGTIPSDVLGMDEKTKKLFTKKK